MGTIAQELTRIQNAKSDLKTAIEAKGVTVPSATTIDGYANLIGQISGGGGLPATLEIGATTVHTSANTTENIASNDNIRILGSDNHKYTIAKWNAMYVAAGYDRTQMAVTPIGISVDAFDHAGESYLFDRYTGITYNVSGDFAYAAGVVHHSPHNNVLYNNTASGTDYTTSKGWSVAVDGDNLILAETNTGCSWTVSKDCSYATSHKAYNIADRTYYLWAYTEWLRHRFAVSSGVATTVADKTMGQVGIFNSSGSQAAVGEDMYFWVRATSSDSWQNTNILAKYNLNNRTETNGYNLTSAIADVIYARQIANGINMNDTGVNSSSKPILTPGSKGAEAIAVGGYWYIITPYIAAASSIMNNSTNNIQDSPAIYWAIHKGCHLPSDTMLYAISVNNTLFEAIYNYIKNTEGWTVESLPTNTYAIWSVTRSNHASAYYVFYSYSSLYNYSLTYQCYVVGSTVS